MGGTFSVVSQETMRLASRDVCDDITWSNTWANRSTLSVPEQLELLERQQRIEQQQQESTRSSLEERLWGIRRIAWDGGYGEAKKERRGSVVMPLYPEPAVIADDEEKQKCDNVRRENNESELELEEEEIPKQRREHRRRRSSKEVVFMDRVVVFQLKEDDRRWSLDSDNDSDDSL